MGMQTDIAIEEALRPIFTTLNAELVQVETEEERGALMRIAAVVLEQFEWNQPQWAKEFAVKWDLRG